MKRLALLAAALAALAAPSVASAGGGMAVFALNRPPAGIVAGDAWIARIRVVTCGGFAAGYAPTVAITERGSGRTLAFEARRGRDKEIYEARVIFPSAGMWSYEIAVNPAMSESYGPVRVAPRRAPARLIAALPPVGAVLLVFGTGLLLRRRKA